MHIALGEYEDQFPIVGSRVIFKHGRSESLLSGDWLLRLVGRDASGTQGIIVNLMVDQPAENDRLEFEVTSY